MRQATTISLQLVSCETLRIAGDSNTENYPGLLFFNVGADSRAAVTAPASQQAFKFLILGIHDDDSSAISFIDNNRSISPWLNECSEVWSAVLKPFHHKGEANYVDVKNPGRIFFELCDSPGPNVPIVVLTTSGWNTSEGLDMNRVKEFSEGVLGVRASMTGVTGLHSQQSFFFPGVLAYDPITVTLWRDSISVGKFAYGPGSHQIQIEKQRTQNLADRTSFTRCKIIHSEGTWYKTEPTKWS
jgi:hypothetical protein